MKPLAAALRVRPVDALLGCALLALFLVRLDYGELFNPDEARHAEIAREMYTSGNYLIPRLHGQPYYDKPALFHQTLATSFCVFGETAAAARLPSALAALWTLAVTAWWTRRAYSAAAARFAVVGLATAPLFVGLGRFAILDSAFLAALTTAFAWLGVWLLDELDEREIDERNQDERRELGESGDSERRKHGPWALTPFYAAIGVAVLIKGPAACLLGALVAVGGVCIAGSWRDLPRLRPLRGTLTIAAVACPWFVAAWAADPDYIETFFWTHNVARFLGTDAISHQHSFFYYLIGLPIALLPWTPVVATAIYRRGSSQTKSAADLFSIVWFSAIFIFFLPAQTKIVTYLLPAWPPLAALTANFLVTRTDRGRIASAWERAYTVTWTLVPLLLGTTIVTWISYSYGRWLPLVSLLPAVALAAYSLGRRTRLTRNENLGLLAAGTLACAVLTYGPGIELLYEWKGVRSAAAVIENEVAADTELISFNYPPHALAFYLGRAVPRTKDAGTIQAALGVDTPTAVITHRKHLEQLGFEPLPLGVKVIWSNESGRILLANSPANLKKARGNPG